MIKIIEEVKEKQTSCDKCWTCFSYEISDIKIYETGYLLFDYNFIECPKCGERIKINV